jgi:hypothetical protein
MEACSQNGFPHVTEAFGQSDTIPLGSTPWHPSNQSYLHKGQIATWVYLPIGDNSPKSEHVKAFGQDDKHISLSKSPAIVHKALFSNPSCVIHMQ